jgi:hypothetical protein
LDGQEALTVVGMKMVGSALTFYNQFLRKEATPTFFKFILGLRKMLVPSTSKASLWNRWDKGTIFKDGRIMGIHEFSNWLNEMQIKLIDKHGNQSISDEVKRQKFLNNLPPYMEETLRPQIKDDWGFDKIVEAAEGYEAAHKKQRTGGGPRQGSKQVLTPASTSPAPHFNKDPRRRQKSGFNPSNNNPGRHTNNKGKDPDWDVVNKTLTPTVKMRLIREKKCLWCRNEGHNFKDCRQRQQKKPIRTAAQLVGHQFRTQPRSTPKGKRQLPKKAIEAPDNSKVQVKVNGHTALALVDLQTKGGDLINSQFVYLYQIPTKTIEKKSLNTAIKGSKGTIDKTCEIKLNWNGYEETRTFYVAHLSSWDLILGQPALESVKAIIPAGQNPVTIQPDGMQRFALTPWRGARTTHTGISSAALQVSSSAKLICIWIFPLCSGLYWSSWASWTWGKCPGLPMAVSGPF